MSSLAAGPDLSGWNGYLDGSENLVLLKELLCDRYEAEFFWSTDFGAGFVDACAWEGLLPMATRVAVPASQGGGGLELFTPKWHLSRCVLYPQDWRLPRSVKRRARGLVLTVNRRFDEVLAACRARHGAEWLRPPLVAVFGQLFEERHLARWRTRFSSVELWDETKLVAGEIGYFWGSAYTSLSGFYAQSGSGSVQLAVLARLLFRHGLGLWDLGMELPYKLALGARLLERRQFMEAIPRLQAGAVDLGQLENREWDCVVELEAGQ